MCTIALSKTIRVDTGERGVGVVRYLELADKQGAIDSIKPCDAPSLDRCGVPDVLREKYAPTA